MKKKYRILVCELHEESNTFNPLISGLDNFRKIRCAGGQDVYDLCRELPCAVHGMIDAIEEKGGTVIPVISLNANSGGRIADEVQELFLNRVLEKIREAGNPDGIFVSLHGATCSESEDDTCGYVLEKIREAAGGDTVIAASFDMHANITERILENTDIVCAYQTYPHVDFYETGYRAAYLGMKKLAGDPVVQAAVILPMMVPPAGYTTQDSPFKEVIDEGKARVASGEILDFSVCQVQPWLDIPRIGSAVIAAAETGEAAEESCRILAEKLFSIREACEPELMSIDEVIDYAEQAAGEQPVILVDAADSPNGGAVGDSVAAAIRLFERGSSLRSGMFVRDPEAAARAFAVGVGHTAVFSIGAGYTPSLPGPLVAEARVLSLHEGTFLQEGPAGRGFPCDVGKAAVLGIGPMQIMVCEAPTASGDPQILRHFGIEPKLCDLVVVKANTSFRVPYSAFTDDFCYADTPGAGTSNLRSLPFQKLPRPFYPFDSLEGYTIEPPRIYRF